MIKDGCLDPKACWTICSPLSKQPKHYSFQVRSCTLWLQTSGVQLIQSSGALPSNFRPHHTSDSLQPLTLCWFESLQFSPLLQTSCFVSMSVTTIRRPCFCPMPFLLHSHSMTSVKRTSSFHENSHSTRARSRVSRKQVIQNVSNLLETMSHAAAQQMGDTHDASIPHI